MATVTKDSTQSLADAILEAVSRRPGITVAELAAELGIGDAGETQEALSKLRSALAQVRPDTEDAEPVDAVETWGPEPSDDELARARTRGEANIREALETVLAEALTRQEAADHIGITTQAVSERLKAGKLTALRRGREWRFPLWQFTEDGTVPGLPDVIAKWPGSPLALSVWAMKPSADLDGRTPAKAMTYRHGTERVLELVNALTAAAW